MAAAAADDEEYEICNDDGFVYKRRRGLYPDVAPRSVLAAGPDPEAVRSRRRRRAVRRLREERRRDLALWEAFGVKLEAELSAPVPPPPQAPPASPRAAAATDTPASILDKIRCQEELTEAILKKVAGLCDEFDALLGAHMTGWPVWGDPKDLGSLQSPDAPGYKNEGNGAFQKLDSRQGRSAIDARGDYGYQEAAGVSPAAVQMVESGETVKKDLHPSTLSENRKKNGVTRPPDSKSVKTPKRFHQSTSPYPVSSNNARRKTRAAAAKMHNQEASS